MMKPDYWGYGTERLPGCSIPIYHTSKFLKGMHIIDANHGLFSGGKLDETRLRSNSSLW